MSKTSRDILFKGRKIIDDAIKAESRNQGHYLTGGLERSLTADVTESRNQTIVDGFAVFYAGILNDGVPADRIPFGGTSTGAKTSKYIQGLFMFWKLRGLSEKEALRAAFATAKKHSKEGMPTKASSRFSKTGERKQLLTRAINKVSKRVDTVIMKDFTNEIDKTFHKTKSETI
jgi:hypothetical protein